MSARPGHDIQSVEREVGAAAGRCLRVYADAGLTLAAAESLTGGLLTGALSAVPGSSVVLRGGLVTYATDLKSSLLGVPDDLLAVRGPVDPDVAAWMARGAARACRADVGVATTGVAGPDPQDDVAPGTVYIATYGPNDSTRIRALHLAGDRSRVRLATVLDALLLAVAAVEDRAEP